MSDRRYQTKVFTGEAVVAGCVMSFVIGFIVGLAAGLMTHDPGIGMIVFGVTFAFSMDLMFRGTP